MYSLCFIFEGVGVICATLRDKMDTIGEIVLNFWLSLYKLS